MWLSVLVLAARLTVVRFPLATVSSPLESYSLYKHEQKILTGQESVIGCLTNFKNFVKTHALNCFYIRIPFIEGLFAGHEFNSHFRNVSGNSTL